MLHSRRRTDMTVAETNYTNKMRPDCDQPFALTYAEVRLPLRSTLASRTRSQLPSRDFILQVHDSERKQRDVIPFSPVSRKDRWGNALLCNQRQLVRLHSLNFSASRDVGDARVVLSALSKNR